MTMPLASGFNTSSSCTRALAHLDQGMTNLPNPQGFGAMPTKRLGWPSTPARNDQFTARYCRPVHSTLLQTSSQHITAQLTALLQTSSQHMTADQLTANYCPAHSTTADQLTAHHCRPVQSTLLRTSSQHITADRLTAHHCRPFQSTLLQLNGQLMHRSPNSCVGNQQQHWALLNPAVDADTHTEGKSHLQWPAGEFALQE